MSRKPKFSSDEKVSAVNLYLDGKSSMNSIAKQLGISYASFVQWVINYKAMGADAFITKNCNRYSLFEKKQAVEAYLAGEGSYMIICKKFKIRSAALLRRWVKQYNGQKKLNVSGIGGTAAMTKGRKTTFDERVEIASFCIAHNHNYTETAEKFGVSYQQARNYTVKFENNGINALEDNRGKRKDKDSLTEIEKLRAELKLEKAMRQKAEMEASFLKKLKETERRWD